MPKEPALHNMRFDILMPDFLWASGFFENLSFDEQKKYISFQCSFFDMDKYLQSSTYYDEQPLFFSSIVYFVMQTQYLEYLPVLLFYRFDFLCHISVSECPSD